MPGVRDAANRFFEALSPLRVVHGGQKRLSGELAASSGAGERVHTLHDCVVDVNVETHV